MGKPFRRNGAWYIRFTDINGKPRKKRIGKSKRLAHEALAAVEGLVVRKQYLGIVDDSSISFLAFSAIWEKRVLPPLAKSTGTRWAQINKTHLTSGFAGPLRAIGLPRIEAYRQNRLAAGGGNVSINHELRVLRHMLIRAVRWEYLSTNPMVGFKFLPEAPGRTRFLSEEELDALLSACDDSRSPQLKPFVLFALNTGMRRGEVLNLKRGDVDWANHFATLRQTKNGDSRTVPLNQTAYEALRSLPTRIDGKLFDYKDGHAVSRSFSRACERAKIADFRLHDLRHTFASYHALNGTQGRGLQALLGHKDMRMTARYSHLSDQFIRAAVDSVQLGAGVSPKRTPKKGNAAVTNLEESRVGTASNAS